jgi:hypothetical protein
MFEIIFWLRRMVKVVKKCQRRQIFRYRWSTTFLAKLIYRLIHFRLVEHCWLALVAWCGSMSRHGEQQESSQNLVQPNHRLNTAEDCSALTWLSYCTTTVQYTAGSDAWHGARTFTRSSSTLTGASQWPDLPTTLHFLDEWKKNGA